MKIIFMGTPDFAVPTLEALVAAGHEIVLVVTQPDKPKGRGKAMALTPVKEKALELGIATYQPEKIRAAESVARLKEVEADLAVVVAFGQILSKELLEHPKYGCINVHASLLPKYRGAAPIQWAVMDGERESGVTIQQMDEGLDTGDVIALRSIPLAEDETGGSLHDKLAVEGASLCVSAVEEIAAGRATRTPQSGEETHYAHMLRKDMGNMDWSRPAVELERLVRGLNPWPATYTFYRGKMLKIWRTSLARPEELPTGMEPGECRNASGRLLVCAGEGGLFLEELQLEGKKRMSCADFLRGFSLEDGARFSRDRKE